MSIAPNEDVVVRSFAPDPRSNVVAAHFEGGQDQFDVLDLRAADRLRPAPKIPAEPTPAPALDLSDAPAHTFEMRGREINDKSMTASRIDETVDLGSTEIGKVSNTGGGYHDLQGQAHGQLESTAATDAASLADRSLGAQFP